MNPTNGNPQSQPQNGYGRIPDELFGKLVQVSGNAGKLFAMLCIKANRKRQPLGVVDANISAMALVWMGTSRGAVRRYLRELDNVGLIDYIRRPGVGAVRVRHYLDQGDPVDQGDPDMDHGDPPPDQGDPVGGSGRSTISPQTQQSVDVVLPCNVVDDLVDVGYGKTPSRRKRRPPKPKVVWDEKEQDLVPLDKAWAEEFKTRWKEKLGDERYQYALKRLTAWLARPDRAHRRGPTSRLDRTMENWMMGEVS